MLQNLFSFATLRGVAKPETALNSLYYIQDEEVNHYGEEVRRIKRLFYIPPYDDNGNYVDESGFTIPQLVYKRLFCDSPPYDSFRKTIDYEGGNSALTLEVLHRFTYPVDYSCANGYPDISVLTEYPYLANEEVYRVIYNKPAGREAYLLEQVSAYLEDFLEEHTHKNFTKHDLKTVCNKIAEILKLEKGKTIVDFVYAARGYNDVFRQTKAQTFDALYALYILRRLQSIDLEPHMQQIRILYLLELLAQDYNRQVTHAGNAVQFVLDQLNQGQPAPFIRTLADVQTLLRTATVVIHPMFALLHYIRKPFNLLKPIGIADLKIVKSRLIGYKASEISHIHNIMTGETNEYTFREFNKTQEVFSLSSETSSSVQKENQTTDKNELKREIDSVLKSDLDLNANASVSLKYGIITNATVSAGMAFSTSKEESTKSAADLLRETLEKAISKIETKTTQQRSATKLFETESTNKHSFSNTAADSKHMSGIFRWVDKIYEAQVYNYGKRLMYEFIIPEPAAFFVKSRLTNYGLFDLECPKEPVAPIYHEVKLKHPDPGLNKILLPGDITKPVFQELCQNYDLSEFSYPAEKKKTVLVDQASGKSVFSQRYGGGKDHEMTSDYYDTTGIEVGYDIELISTSGQLLFYDQAGEEDINSERNLYVLYINGQQIDFEGRNINIFPRQTAVMDAHKIQGIGEQSKNIKPGGAKLNVGDGKVSVVFLFKDISFYLIQIALDLKINTDFLFSWQTRVYNKIKAVEQLKVDQLNQELLMDYNAAKSEYRNKKAALESSAINDLLQGKQESYNTDLIETELKKSCLSFLSKEFDSIEWDDRLQPGAVGTSSIVPFTYPRLNTDTECSIEEATFNTRIPVINLQKAKQRGSFVQFMEQAFEWDKLSYIFYPYFWADRPKWMELLHREDPTDSKMTAFLKAGSARVLVAVHPAYNKAVLHFLATGQAWEGGESPAVGDPLFIPLYEEIRDTQDNMQDAVAEGKPYRYHLGTQLVYLQDSTSGLPEDFD